jgi:hypothetical protein
MPTYLLNLVPFTALLGTSMALGGLAHSNELTAMRASGISIQRIGLATLKSGAIFIVFVLIIMEWVAPPLYQHAIQQQSLALSGGELLIEKHGTWILQGNRFINIRNKHEGNTLADIHVFEFDPEKQQLKRYLHADQVETKNRQQWLYRNLIVKNYEGKDVVTRHEAERVQESYLTDKQLSVMEQPINSLSPSGLYQYLEYMRASEQATERFGAGNGKIRNGILAEGYLAVYRYHHDAVFIPLCLRLPAKLHGRQENCTRNHYRDCLSFVQPVIGKPRLDAGRKPPAHDPGTDHRLPAASCCINATGFLNATDTTIDQPAGAEHSPDLQP